MSDSRRGSALIMLLLAILVIYLCSTMASKSLLVSSPENGPTPIDRSWAAVCAANKALISQQLQLYAISNPPMKELDLNKLFAPAGFNIPDKCPCSYTLSPTGQVVCKIHP